MHKPHVRKRTMKNNNKTSGYEILSLISVALHTAQAGKPIAISDWKAIDILAKKHAVIPLIYHAVMLLPIKNRPPMELLTEWKKYTISSVMRNELLVHAQTNVVKLLQNDGVQCAILKGSSVAILYPKLEMRALGDIDILVSKDQCQQAVEVLVSDGYHKHETDHPFHIGFDKSGVYLELHYDLTEYSDTPIGEYIKDRLSNALSRIEEVNVDNSVLPVLSEPDQAIALLLHMERHMVSGGIGLRQLCDWCVFIDSLSQECLVNDVLPTIRECQLYQFASVLTRICVDYLGLDELKHQWCMYIPKRTADALLDDIMDSGNIMSHGLERTSSSMLVKGEESTEGHSSMFTSAAKNLTQSARKQFPICNKLPVLLPIYWVYIPVRYLYRAMKGTRPKQSINRIVGYALKRKRLYRKLELFKK